MVISEHAVVLDYTILKHVSIFRSINILCVSGSEKCYIFKYDEFQYTTTTDYSLNTAFIARLLYCILLLCIGLFD